MCPSIDLTFVSAYSCCTKWCLCSVTIETECASICVCIMVIIYYIFSRLSKAFGCYLGLPYAGINSKLP